jgi:hypothetical protein
MATVTVRKSELAAHERYLAERRAELERLPVEELAQAAAARLAKIAAIFAA